MIAKHFKKQVGSIKEQMSERKSLLLKFLKFHNHPIIVHAIHHKSIFHKVLREDGLKLPKTHTSPRKTPYMERFLGIDNCIYYSLGFVYYSSYKWKYNLIFDIEFLKNLVYYNNSVNFQAARAVVNYWYENDPIYFEKLANKNKTTRKVIDRYLYEPYNGKTRRVLDFWKIQKELFDFINVYPHKNVLLKIIKSTGKKHLLKYPQSKEDALACYLEEKAPEMVQKNPNILSKNPNFIGFFIPGRIDSKTKKILQQKYSNKILFDGNKVIKISEL